MTRLSDLTPDPHNARTHNDHNIGMIRESLQRHGPGRSILIDEDDQIIAGHGVVEAAKLAGFADLQVIDAAPGTVTAVRLVGLTDEQKRELAIADNRTGETSEWDLEELQLALDDGADLDWLWSDDELAALLGNDDEGPTAEPDGPQSAPEPPAVPITQPGDLWILGDHRLLCGDATNPDDLARLMDGHNAAMVWTDPPYGVSIGDKNQMLQEMNKGRSHKRITKNLQNDTLDEEQLRSMIAAAFDNAVAACEKGAVWHVAAPAGPLYLVFGGELHRLGIWRQTIQWVKTNATFSPLGVDYHWQAEPIFHGWVPGAKHAYYGDRTQTTVWEIARPQKSPEHPTMKPIALVQRSLENHTRKGDLVLDMFGGSGTTLITGELLDRPTRLLEIDAGYCDVVIARWEQMTGLSAVRG